MADDYEKFIPARFGTAQGKSVERVMFEHVAAPYSQQTVEYVHPDGAITRLRTHGGMLRYVHFGIDEEEDEETTVHIPDILSGVVIGGFIDLDQPKCAGVLRTTPYCATMTGMYTGAIWNTPRLNVPLSPYIQTPYELSTTTGFTQYSVVQPYKYTGRMRWLVQWLLGAGKLPATSRYDDILTPPADCMPTQEAGSNVQITYNYRYNQSHGLVFGADGKPWIAMIDQALGVWAFLLPVIHGSNTAQFAAAVTNAVTSAKLNALDELHVALAQFKGIPTGENITPETLSAWEKSGCAIKLLDVNQMGAYGGSQGVASQLGWAFNYAGTEARVVGIKSQNGASLSYKSTHYMRLSFSIGAVRAPLNTSAVQAIRAKYIVPGAPAHVRMKAHYMSDSDAYNVLNGHIQFNDLVSAPIATASAIFSEIETSVFRVQFAQIKAWDDLYGFCMTLGLDENLWAGSPNGACTTPVHVFYDKSDVLRELRVKPNAGDISGGAYIADVFDTTGQSNGSTKTENSSSKVYTAIAERYVMFQPASDIPEAWFQYWWTRKTDTVEVTPGHETKGCAFIPCGDRESIVLAKMSTHGPGTKSFEYTFTKTLDNIAYDLFDNYIVGENRQGRVRLISGCWLSNLDFGQFINGNNPIDAQWSRTDGVDSGEWANACAKPYDALYPNPDASLVNHIDVVPAAGAFDAILFANGEQQNIISDAGGRAAMQTKYGAWFVSSTPMPEDQQVMRVTSNCIGVSYVQCYDDINSGKYKIFGTLPMPNAEENDYQFNYIGVIQ